MIKEFHFFCFIFTLISVIFIHALDIKKTILIYQCLLETPPSEHVIFVPTSPAPLKQRPWYLLSCLSGSAYK